MKDRKINATNKSKKERYISTVVCGILGIIGSIGMGFISIGVYLVIPIVIVLECLLIRFDPPLPHWKIWSFSFYIVSAVLGSILYNIYEMVAVYPQAWFAIMYFVPCLWFLYDLFTSAPEDDDMKTV